MCHVVVEMSFSVYCFELGDQIFFKRLPTAPHKLTKKWEKSDVMVPFDASHHSLSQFEPNYYHDAV
jgi:hypothetical protein